VFSTILEQHSSEFVTKTCQALVRNIWNVRAALLESLDKFFEKLDLTSSAKVVSEESIVLILDSLLEGSLRDFKYVGLRNQGLELLKNLIAKLKGKKQLVGAMCWIEGELLWMMSRLLCPLKTKHRLAICFRSH
jgi:hypothetical protein